MSTDTAQIHSDPAETPTGPASANACCGTAATTIPEPVASTCCGTVAEAQTSGGCCGAAAKAEAVAAGTGCCG